MVEISDVTKARPERVTPRPLQQRLQWTARLNPRIATLINTYWSERRYGCSTCREERYWVLC